MTGEIDALDHLIATDQHPARGDHRDARRPGRHVGGDHGRARAGRADAGDAVRRVPLGNQQRGLRRVDPREVEGVGQTRGQLGPRPVVDLDAAHSPLVDTGGLLADVGVLEVGAEHQTDAEFQVGDHRGLVAVGQVDPPQVAGGSVLH